MQNPALASNVVRLPTAAVRKVRQPAPLAMLDAAASLPQHPAEWHDHGGQKAYQSATPWRSAEMMVATAIFKVLSDDQKARVRQAIETATIMNMGDHAATALHIVEGLK